MTMNTGRLKHDLGNILVSHCANKNIIINIYTNGDFMIGWFIGQLIFWVGLITILMWALSRCAGI
jgi:hypothetical protein